MTIDRADFVKLCKNFADAERNLSNTKAAIQEALGVRDNYFGVVKIDWTQIRRVGDGDIILDKRPRRDTTERVVY